MGWAIAHFQFLSRYCSGVATGGARRVCGHDREPARACQGRAVVTNLLGFSVATELAHSVSRQGILVSRQGVGQLGLLVSRHDLLCLDNAASVQS